MLRFLRAHSGAILMVLCLLVIGIAFRLADRSNEPKQHIDPFTHRLRALGKTPQEEHNPLSGHITQIKPEDDDNVAASFVIEGSPYTWRTAAILDGWQVGDRVIVWMRGDGQFTILNFDHGHACIDAETSVYAVPTEGDEMDSAPDG